MQIKYTNTLGWEKPITVYTGYIEPEKIWKIKHVTNAITNKYMYSQRPTNTEGYTLEPKDKIWFQLVMETDKKFKTEMKVFDKKTKFIEDKSITCTL